MINPAYIKARWTLGAALLRKILSWPFQHDRGLAHWLERLAEEDLVATPKDAWRHQAGATRCIGCGLCDAVSLDGLEPSRLILSVARRPQDALIAEEHAAELAYLAKDIAEICPARVDVEDIVALLRDNAAQVRGIKK
ncbi:MAG: hypothetical protein R3C68_06705 [Myxococcota bacterium]